MNILFRISVALAIVAVLTVPALAQGRPGQVTWRGNVDDTIIVYVHRDSVTERTISGKDPQNIDVQFLGRLPHRPVTVMLSDWSGRGHVRIVQQPNPDNDFTAAVRVRDPQDGQSHYKFTLTWQPVGPGGPPPPM